MSDTTGLRAGGPSIGMTAFGAELPTRTKVELARQAEQAGFARFLLVELVETNDTLVQLAAIAASTRTIGIGTGIANIHLRRPDMLGAAAVAVADVSEGRLVLGLGPNNRRAVEGLGLTWTPPARALRETTERLRALFAGETGRCGPSPHPIPIPWAAVGLGTAAAAGRHADGVMAYLATASRLAEVGAAFRGGAESAGRDAGTLEFSLLLPTFLDDDLGVARDAARAFLGFYAAMPHYRAMFEASGFEDVASVPDALVDAVVLAGPVGHCRERLAELASVGLTHVDLAPLPVGGRDLPASAAVLARGLAELAG
jgi:5,10-methylenetetrahydromethanopterin reductase